MGCSFCRLIRRPEHLVGRHWYILANWRSYIWWSPDQWVSPCYAIECDRSFYCALFCVFMTRVSQCPISLRAEHPIYRTCSAQNFYVKLIQKFSTKYLKITETKELLHLLHKWTDSTSFRWRFRADKAGDTSCILVGRLTLVNVFQWVN
jgi:hypothetical protein